MFKFKPALREATTLFIGLAGPSSSGKTYSALRLATGLADGGPIFAIDTESSRMLHYADQFAFQHGPLEAPFSPEAYMEALDAAKKAKAKVIIVDSMSHEHEGPGGILEQHDMELDRMVPDGNYGRREAMKFSAWIKPKAAHNRFVNDVLQLGTHVVFCFRAKEKLKMVKNAKGKMEPTPIGWQPICAVGFEFEMTSLLMLPPGSEGRPDLAAPANKVQLQHKPIFKAGAQIDEAMGQALGEWAAGSTKPKAAAKKKAPAKKKAAEEEDASGLEAEAYDCALPHAKQGTVSFRAWWNTTEGKGRRAFLASQIDALQAIAAEADAADDDDPFPNAGDGGTRLSPAEAEPQDADAPQGDPPHPGGTAADPDALSADDLFVNGVLACATVEAVEQFARQQAGWLDALDEPDKARAWDTIELRKEAIST